MILTRARLLVAMLVLSLFASGLVGCDGDEKERQTGGSRLTVLAASSLTDAFGELESRFEERNPGTDLRTSFAGSSELLTQIQQGAPADVFASADEVKMDTAAEKGLVREPRTFARNRPVVLVPADNPARIEEFRDLAEADARIVLAEEGVPIAEYARDILTNADAEYGDDFEWKVLEKVVSREANVRTSANRVALGEADATFVYQSDVTPDIRNRVQVIQIPENLNVLATYPIAVTEGSENPELAQEWIELMLSDEGQDVLEEHGFERVS